MKPIEVTEIQAAVTGAAVRFVARLHNNGTASVCRHGEAGNDLVHVAAWIDGEFETLPDWLPAGAAAVLESRLRAAILELPGGADDAERRP